MHKKYIQLSLEQKANADRNGIYKQIDTNSHTVNLFTGILMPFNYFVGHHILHFHISLTCLCLICKVWLLDNNMMTGTRLKAKGAFKQCMARMSESSKLFGV